jgi:hypothetical protein
MNSNKNQIVSDLKQLISKYGNKIPLNECFSPIWTSYNINGFLDLKTHTFTSNFKPLKLHSDFSPPSKIIKCKKIILLPTDHQKTEFIKYV